MNTTTCTDTAQLTCDVLLATTGIPGQGWVILSWTAIIVGSAGMVLSQRMMKKGREMRRAAKAARAH